MACSEDTFTALELQSLIAEAGPAQSGGEVTQPDVHVDPQVSAEALSPPTTANAEHSWDAGQELCWTLPSSAATEVHSPTVKGKQSHLPAAAFNAHPADKVTRAKAGDTVDASVGPLASLKKGTVKMEEPQSASAARAPEKEERKIEDVNESETEERMARAKLEPAAEVAATANRVNGEKLVTNSCQLPHSEAEPVEAQTWSPEPDSTLAETAEWPLYNGLHWDMDELSEKTVLSNRTPLHKLDNVYSWQSTTVVKTAIPAQERRREKRDYTFNCATDNTNTVQGRP